MNRLRAAFAAVEPTPAEIARARPGDEIVPGAEVVMDRAFSLPAPVEEVWPWFVQLGKQRSGWYLTRSVERVIPSARRAIRRIDPALQGLEVGDVIPDWGGRDETFEVALLEPNSHLVHISKRGNTELSWSINVEPDGDEETRAALRLRLGPVKRRRLVETAGDFFDLMTIAGMAAGLAERLRETG